MSLYSKMSNVCNGVCVFAITQRMLMIFKTFRNKVQNVKYDYDNMSDKMQCNAICKY